MKLDKVKAVILCGGEGTRLRPLTYYFQKTMIPVGRWEKPLLEYIVRLMAYHGLKRIVMLVGYKARQIMNYFDDGSRFNVEISYVKDKAGRRGNGWALLNAYMEGAISGDELLLIYYGDILSNIDLSEMLTVHRKAGADATLALASGYQVPVGVAEVEDGRVKGLVEKPEIPVYATIGVALLEGGLLEEFKALGEGVERLDIMADFIPHVIRRGGRVKAYVHGGFWYDVASMERYERLNHEALDEHLGMLFDEADK